MSKRQWLWVAMAGIAAIVVAVATVLILGMSHAASQKRRMASDTTGHQQSPLLSADAAVALYQKTATATFSAAHFSSVSTDNDSGALPITYTGDGHTYGVTVPASQSVSYVARQSTTANLFGQFSKQLQSVLAPYGFTAQAAQTVNGDTSQVFVSPSTICQATAPSPLVYNLGCVAASVVVQRYASIEVMLALYRQATPHALASNQFTAITQNNQHEGKLSATVLLANGPKGIFKILLFASVNGTQRYIGDLTPTSPREKYNVTPSVKAIASQPQYGNFLLSVINNP